MNRKTPYKTIYKEPLSKEAKMKILGAFVFWLVFIIFVICLFIINWPRIRTTMQNALWPAWFKSRSSQNNHLPIAPLPDTLQDEDTLFTDEPFTNQPAAWDTVQATQPESGNMIREVPGVSVVSQQGSEPERRPNPVSVPAARASPETSASDFSRSPQPSSTVPYDQTVQPGSPAVSDESSRLNSPGTFRDRSLYFIQIDRNGAILRSKVTRAVPSSNSPLLDVLEVLLKGPSDEETRRGIISLIPQGTKILSARVLKDTAYISISEDFQYNTYGVEGYAAQLTQLIWTATEFTNVKDVQILIEGRRIDYLGEGIWIGSPISREML